MVAGLRLLSAVFRYVPMPLASETPRRDCKVLDSAAVPTTEQALVMHDYLPDPGVHLEKYISGILLRRRKADTGRIHSFPHPLPKLSYVLQALLNLI